MAPRKCLKCGVWLIPEHKIKEPHVCKEYNLKKATESPAPSGQAELVGCVFKDVAKKCPWRQEIKEKNWCLIATTHAGMCGGTCEEKSCGLFYMLDLFKLPNT